MIPILLGLIDSEKTYSQKTWADAETFAPNRPFPVDRDQLFLPPPTPKFPPHISSPPATFSEKLTKFTSLKIRKQEKITKIL